VVLGACLIHESIFNRVQDKINIRTYFSKVTVNICLELIQILEVSAAYILAVELFLPRFPPFK